MRSRLAGVPRLTGSPHNAANPANALLNYLYAILEAEARIALLTIGLGPKSTRPKHTRQMHTDPRIIVFLQKLREAHLAEYLVFYNCQRPHFALNQQSSM